MASRVTQSGRRDRRFSNQAKGFGQQVVEQGGARPVSQGLGEMPLTLWMLVAAVVLYLYIRRANLGIDLHPSEAVRVKPTIPFIGPPAPRAGSPFAVPPMEPAQRPSIELLPTVPIGGILQ